MTTSELGSAVTSAGGTGGQDSEASAAAPPVEPGGRSRAGRHPAGRRRRARWPVNVISAVVLVVGLALTAVLSWTTYHLNRKNENRLLRLETTQASTVLSAVVPTIQTPLASAVGIAARNPYSSVPRFRAYIASYVGAKQPFASASLYRVDAGSAQLLVTVGSKPRLPEDPAAVTKFLTAAQAGWGIERHRTDRQHRPVKCEGRRGCERRDLAVGGVRREPLAARAACGRRTRLGVLRSSLRALSRPRGNARG